MKKFDIFEGVVIDKYKDFFTGQKRKVVKQVTKKPRIELYPIKRVQVWRNGKAVETYWVVVHPNGVEIQCKSYDAAHKIQQETLDKKEKV